MQKWLIFFLLITSSLVAQVENSRGVFSGTYLPNFFIYFTNYQSEIEGKTRVDVFLQVPYGSIQFIKSGNTFKGKYSVSLGFYDEDKDNLLFEKIWNEKLATSQFSQTYSKNNYNINYKDFNLEAGTYTVVCIVEDLNSQNNVTLEKTIEVREIESEIDISDIVLIKDKVNKNGNEQIIPNVSNIIYSEDTDLEMFFEVYSDKEQEVFIDYKVLDETRNKSFDQSRIETLKKGATFLTHNMKDISLPLGEYKLHIYIRSRDGDELSSHGVKFRAAMEGFPISIVDIEEAIEQLEYIASGSVIDSLEEAETIEEKMHLFKAFWNKKDPSPNTDENEIMLEYYRRIEYSNSNFKGYSGQGWRTDMGMVYTMLGPPDNVYREPVAMDSRPYEYWEYYNIQRTFLFMDQTGFGDYRLVNRDYGDWYRYRP